MPKTSPNPLFTAVVLALSYRGQNYYGFQRQKNKTQPGVQNYIEKALSSVFNQDLPTIAAGRTDKAVHADHLLLLFQAPAYLLGKIGCRKLQTILNKLLPPDIRILHAEHAKQREDLLYYFPALKPKTDRIPSTKWRNEFHPRYSAHVRLYRYRLADESNTACSNGDLLPAALPLPYSLKEYDEHGKYGLRSYFQNFLGCHDFTSFCSARESSLNKLRHVYAIDVLFNLPYIYIDIYANAFLQSMVRSIIGNTLDLYRKNKDPKAISSILAAKNPNLAKARVPAAPLSLRKVYYCPLFQAAPRLFWNTP